jgi:hypothetical protein
MPKTTETIVDMICQKVDPPNSSGHGKRGLANQSTTIGMEIKKRIMFPTIVLYSNFLYARKTQPIVHNTNAMANIVSIRPIPGEIAKLRISGIKPLKMPMIPTRPPITAKDRKYLLN